MSDILITYFLFLFYLVSFISVITGARIVFDWLVLEAKKRKAFENHPWTIKDEVIN